MGQENETSSRRKGGSIRSIFIHADGSDVWLMLVGLIGSVGSGLTVPLGLLLTSRLMNNIGSSSTLSQDIFLQNINKYALVYLFLASGTFVVNFLAGYCWTRTAERQAARMRVRYLKAVLRQDVAYFDLYVASMSEVVTTVSNDSSTIQDVISEKVPNLLQNVSLFVGCYVAAFVLLWRLAIVAVPFVVFLVIPGMIYGRALMRIARQMREEYNVAGAIAEQAISSVRAVYSFVGEEKSVSAFSEALDGSLKLGLRQGFTKGLAIGSNSISYAIWSFVSYYSSRLVMYHGAQGGTVYAAGISMTMGGLSLGAAMSNLKGLSEACSAGERIMQVIKRVPKIDSENMKGQTFETASGEIEFSHVEFAYPSRPESLILKDFCLKIPSGKTLALVGPSGSGKSTVIALLQRFYDPLGGEIWFDGISIERLQIKWLRSQMGLVSQEPSLFATTIKDNILFGKEDANMEEVIEASKASNAHDFISQLPLGYDTQVGERGVQMSGGQKQRIAIARAIIKRPRVLLLDEATSALDSESESVVQEALDKAAVGRTTIVIAHRLSTVRNAHTIAVLQDGHVLETGSHHELTSRPDGLYTSLVRLQQPKKLNTRPEPEDGSSSGRHSTRKDPNNTSSRDELTFHPDGVDSSLNNRPEPEGGSSLGHHITTFDPNNTSSHDELAFHPDDLYTSAIRRQQPITLNNRPEHEGGSSSGRHITTLDPNNTSSRRLSLLSRSSSKNSARVHSFHAEDGVVGSEPREGPKAPSFRRLLAMNAAEWKQASLGCVSAALFGAIQPAYSLVMGSMISLFFLTNHDEIKEKIRTYSIFFVALAVFTFLINILQHYSFAYMGEHLTKRVRVRMLHKVLTFEVGWFDKDENSTAAICSTLAKETNVVRSLVGDRISLLVQTFSAVIVACIVGIVIAWRLAVVMIAMQPLVIFCFYTHRVLLKNISKNALNSQAHSSSLAAEAVSNHRTITAFSSQARILKMFDSAQRGPRRESLRQSWYAGLGLASSQFVLFATTAFVFWYSGKLLGRRLVSPTAMFQTYLVLLSTGYVLANVGSMTSDLAKGAAAVASVFALLDRQTKIDPENPSGHRPETLSGRIEFRDVRFAYPRRPGVVIFESLSVKIGAGESAALVGQSGSGKSTLIALIERFYDPIQGSVMIDGRDVRSYHLKSLRKHIALVSQEPALFARSIKDNIAFGGSADEAEIVEAAKTANAHDFISGLKEGYETLCGDKGAQLSGGQKQRIAIARAVLKNPKILLLDEATSALDSRSEKSVQVALERVMVGRTSVVVAHRLSTIQNCDVIIVLEKGKIVERGTHLSLMAKGPKGAYYSLATLQRTPVN